MIPQDGAMLYSYINMKLRNNECNLDELCENMDLDLDEIIDRLAAAGFYYDEELNRFAPL